MKRILTSHELGRDSAEEIRSVIPYLHKLGTKIYEAKRQQIYRVKVGELDLVAKTYESASPSRIFSAHTGFSRAKRSFQAGMLLRKSGVSTPAPLMLVEETTMGYTQSTLIADYFPGKTLREMVEKGCPLPASLPYDLLKMLLRLQRSRIRHGDFHARNLIVSASGKIALLDLDGASKRFFKRVGLRNNLEDRDRLVGSLYLSPELQEELVSILGAPGTPLPAS